MRNPCKLKPMLSRQELCGNGCKLIYKRKTASLKPSEETCCLSLFSLDQCCRERFRIPNRVSRERARQGRVFVCEKTVTRSPNDLTDLPLSPTPKGAVNPLWHQNRCLAPIKRPHDREMKCPKGLRTLSRCCVTENGPARDPNSDALLRHLRHL